MKDSTKKSPAKSANPGKPVRSLSPRPVRVSRPRVVAGAGAGAVPAAAAVGGVARAQAASLQRRQRKLAAKQRAILDAALHLFSRYGLHGVSLDAVAELADVSKTNLLYYFPSKEALYVAVLREVLAQWLAPLATLDVQQDPGEALRAYIRAKLVVSRDAPEASRLFCLEVVQGAPLLKAVLQGELRELVEGKCEVLASWMAQGRLREVAPLHFILSIWAVTQHYADFASQVQALCGQDLRDPAFFEEVAVNLERIILGGVLPQ